MMQTDDPAVRVQREAQERAAADAEGRRKNVALFETMFLSLGPDAMKLDSTRHDLELAEAKASAAARWSRLVELEAQVQREAANLAARPRKRPSEPPDAMLAAEVIRRLEDEFAAQTDARRASLEELKEQAKRERAELTSFVVRNGMPREERKGRR